MYLSKIKKEERILINKAKNKYLKAKPSTNRLTNGNIIVESLKKYIGG